MNDFRGCKRNVLIYLQVDQEFGTFFFSQLFVFIEVEFEGIIPL